MKPDFEVFRDLMIGAAMCGIAAPLMAIGWWNGVSRRPASPALIKGIWLFFGSLGVIGVAAAVIIGLFGVRAR